MKKLTDYIKSMQESAFERGGSELGIPWYNAHGDCIQVLAKDHLYKAKRVDAYLTVYNSLETEETIGFQIKDVHALLQELESDGLVIQTKKDEDGFKEISVSFLLSVSFGKSGFNEENARTYRQIAQTPKQDKVKVSDPLAA